MQWGDKGSDRLFGRRAAVSAWLGVAYVWPWLLSTNDQGILLRRRVLIRIFHSADCGWLSGIANGFPFFQKGFDTSGIYALR